ncbi:hypothetical protein C8R44DRAFT_394265 [Mycena epipterygia]|nr:hypothetical protein C8R44DRAFT_394265 [Mycena epipterygia]
MPLPFATRAKRLTLVLVLTWVPMGIYYAFFWDPTARLCRDHPCVDLQHGLVAFDNHLRHLTTVWDLIEGLGHPGGNIFTPTTQRITSNLPLIYNDPKSREFGDDDRKLKNS